MPTVPKYGAPQERLSALQPRRASPGDFAASGQQLQQLGAAAQGAAGRVGEILVKQQEKRNLDDVFRAETALKTWELEYGTWLRDQQGANARDITGKAAQEWNNKIQEIGRGLANEPQQRAFAHIAEQRRHAGVESASRHEQRERDRSVLSAGEATVDLGVQAIINDPSSADVNVEGITKTYQALGRHFGESQAEVDKKILAKVNAAHKGVIAAAVDSNPAFARQYYKTYNEKGQIIPSERPGIEKLLREGDVKGFSQRKAAELIAKHGDDTEAAIAEVRDTVKTPAWQEATVAQLKTQRNERLAFEQEKQGKAMGAFERMMSIPEQGRTVATWEDIPLEIRDNMSDAQEATVREYLRKKEDGGTVDDWDVIAQAEQLIEQGARGGITEPQQLVMYAPHMTPAQFNRLQTKLRSAKEVPHAEVLRVFEDRLGKPRSKFSKNNSEREQWIHFQAYAEDRVKRGENLTDIANQYFMDAYDSKRIMPRGFIGNTLTLGRAESKGKGDFVVEDLDTLGPLDRPIAESLQASGLPVSVSNLQASRPVAELLRNDSLPVTATNMNAYVRAHAELIQAGYEVTPENVRRIAKQIGVEGAAE